MNINELEKLKVVMETNHQSSLAEIDRVIEKMRAVTHGPAATFQAPRPEERMSVIVERTIKHYDGEFEISNIARKYSETTGKRASEHVRKEISDCINKLKHRNPPEIMVVKAGRGSRSGIYKMSMN